jgi:hypothetical protein
VGIDVARGDLGTALEGLFNDVLDIVHFILQF